MWDVVPASQESSLYPGVRGQHLMSVTQLCFLIYLALKSELLTCSVVCKYQAVPSEHLGGVWVQNRQRQLGSWPCWGGSFLSLMCSVPPVNWGLFVGCSVPWREREYLERIVNIYGSGWILLLKWGANAADFFLSNLEIQAHSGVQDGIKRSLMLGQCSKLWLLSEVYLSFSLESWQWKTKQNKRLLPVHWQHR